MNAAVGEANSASRDQMGSGEDEKLHDRKHSVLEKCRKSVKKNKIV